MHSQDEARSLEEADSSFPQSAFCHAFILSIKFEKLRSIRPAVAHMLRNLSKFVSLKSVSDGSHREDCRQAAMFLKKTLTLLGCDLNSPSTSGKPSADVACDHRTGPTRNSYVRSFAVY